MTCGGQDQRGKNGTTQLTVQVNRAMINTIHKPVKRLSLTTNASKLAWLKKLQILRGHDTEFRLVLIVKSGQMTR